MRAMPYSEKLQRYSGENILAQTLTDVFFLNQPNWTKFSEATGITCTSLPCADAAGLERRAGFYVAIASKIWAKENLERIFQ